jgi:hypothetical protein
MSSETIQANGSAKETEAMIVSRPANIDDEDGRVFSFTSVQVLWSWLPESRWGIGRNKHLNGGAHCNARYIW